MKKFELIIFDCDGVLVDSERITNQVFVSMLRDLGLNVTLEDMFEQFVGHSMAQCLEKIAQMLGQAVPPDFVASYRSRTKAALEAELLPIPGIQSALMRVQLPYCVASNGEHEKMRSTLGVTGLLEKFEAKLFSATDVAKPKPAPDVFLYAARHFAVAPENCLVIEDTPTGVCAGRAAGMTVFGYAALTPAHRLIAAGAHEIFTDMTSLPDLIARYQRSFSQRASRSSATAARAAAGYKSDEIVFGRPDNP